MTGKAFVYSNYLLRKTYQIGTRTSLKGAENKGVEERYQAPISKDGIVIPFEVKNEET